MQISTVLRLGTILALAVGSADLAHSSPMNADAALELVVRELLDGKTTGKRVYVNPALLAGGTEVRTWQHTVFTADRPGWLVFVDDVARANFEHPCRYVMVNPVTHELTVHEATTPPLGLHRFRELDTELKRISDAAHEVRPVPFTGQPRPFPNTRGGNSYAVLLSGGASMGSNHIRYYNDMTFMLTTLKEVYSFADDDIYVLMADGTNPAPDRSDGTNSPPDMDGDGTDDIDGPCTLAAIQGVFAELAGFVTSADQVFIFTTDHGGDESGWDVYLNLWGEVMHDEVLASHMNSLPGPQFIVTMEQCFSGGFEDDLQTVPPRVFSSAAAYNEPSYAMSNLLYDEYVYYWISAVRGADPYGTPVDADTNGDGMVTMDEAFLYAEAHDTAPETPQYDDNPAGLGATVSLDFGDRGTLQGTVTELGTGAPIGAAIEAYRQSVGTTYVGVADVGTGAYMMSLPVDTYDVTATAFGYLPATAADLEILIDATTIQDFTLQPAAAGTVQGTVVDSSGAPLDGVEVQVLDAPVSPVTSNELGFYTLELPGGDSYDLQFSLSGHASHIETDVPVVEHTVTTLDVTLGDWYRFLIWEPDPTPMSGAAIRDALAAQGWQSIVVDDLFAYPNPLTDYDAIFVLVGIYSNNYRFPSGSAEETSLVNYLDRGGNLYMEGGDIWCYDSTPATLKSYFGVIEESDGGDDLSVVTGVTGTFADGLSFAYTGENNDIDRLGATPPALELFINDSMGYGCTVAHDAGSYRTIAASYEFGGLVDGAPPSTRQQLMERYLTFFGLAPFNGLFADGFESGDTSAWSAPDR
jgi:hypothetical protein